MHYAPGWHPFHVASATTKEPRLSVTPPAVTEAIDKVAACREKLDACVRAAEEPGDIPACTEEQVRCVAGGLGVSLPDLPLRELADCAEDAAQCTLDARNPEAVVECATSLRRCALGTVDPGEPEGD